MTGIPDHPASTAAAVSATVPSIRLAATADLPAVIAVLAAAEETRHAGSGPIGLRRKRGGIVRGSATTPATGRRTEGTDGARPPRGVPMSTDRRPHVPGRVAVTRRRRTMGATSSPTPMSGRPVRGTPRPTGTASCSGRRNATAGSRGARRSSAGSPPSGPPSFSSPCSPVRARPSGWPTTPRSTTRPTGRRRSAWSVLSHCW